MSDLYAVSYIKPDTQEKSYGYVRQFFTGTSSKEERAIHKRGNLVVDDSVTPECYEIPKASVKAVDFKVIDKHVYDTYLKVKTASPKIFGVGSLFSMPVADGQASYIVTRINKTTTKIEWRGFGGGDRYTDRCLGWGGSFPTTMIKKLVQAEIS